MSKTINDIKTCKDKVEYILQYFPKTRNNDKLLYLEYMKKFYNLQSIIMTGSYNNFEKLFINSMSFKSITRCRRLFQAEGKYIGTNRDNRQEEAELTRNKIPGIRIAFQVNTPEFNHDLGSCILQDFGLPIDEPNKISLKDKLNKKGKLK